MSFLKGLQYIETDESDDVWTKCDNKIKYDKYMWQAIKVHRSDFVGQKWKMDVGRNLPIRQSMQLTRNIRKSYSTSLSEIEQKPNIETHKLWQVPGTAHHERRESTHLWPEPA